MVFVVSGQWSLLTVAILGQVENSDLSRAAASSVVLVAVALAGMAVCRLAVERLRA